MVISFRTIIAALLAVLVVLSLLTSSNCNSDHNTSGEEEEVETESYGQGESDGGEAIDMVLVTTVEGRVYALDTNTGTVKWFMHTGKPLITHSHVSDKTDNSGGSSADQQPPLSTESNTALSSRNTSPTLIPGLGGKAGIYYVDPTSADKGKNFKLQKLPVSVHDMVSMSPFYMGDTIYVGSKETRIYVIEPQSGKLISSFSSQQSDDFCPSLEAIPKDSMLIGRSDYTIRAFDSSGLERWNMTTGEFVHSLSKFGSDWKNYETMLNSQGWSVQTDVRGALHVLDNGSGKKKWIFNPSEYSHNDRVVSAYSPTMGKELLPETSVPSTSTAVTVFIDKVGKSGQLYVLENPSLLHVTSTPLMLPSPDSDMKVIDDEELDEICLVGFHNISDPNNLPVLSPEINLDSEPTKLPNILVVAISLGVSSVVLIVALKRKSPGVNSTAKPTPKQPKKKKKKMQDTKESNNVERDSKPESSNWKIGKLEISPVVLGYGSSGTIVYEGFLDGRKVAVKRMLSAFYKVAQREIQVLLESDTHNNVVTYYAKEEDKEFIYLALSYCQYTLADLIEGDNKDKFTPDLMPGLVTGLVQGLAHLHDLSIVHTDLKPQNILIDTKFCVKISDMGLAKLLEINQSSFSDNGSGSFGWQAPELVIAKENRSRNRITKKVDIFSLGCIFYYIFTQADHPFGDRIEREVNILNKRYNLDKLFKTEHTAYDLIVQMIDSDPSKRPSIEQVAKHPYFWTDNQKLLFLKDASDRLEIEKATSPIVVEYEGNAENVVGTDWKQLVDNRILDNLGKYRKYNYASARDILRLIRNKSHHYWDLPDELRQEIGPPPGPFLEYFTRKFPLLFMATYSILRKYCSEETTFKHYFQ